MKAVLKIAVVIGIIVFIYKVLENLDMDIDFGSLDTDFSGN